MISCVTHKHTQIVANMPFHKMTTTITEMQVTISCSLNSTCSHLVLLYLPITGTYAHIFVAPLYCQCQHHFFASNNTEATE